MILNHSILFLVLGLLPLLYSGCGSTEDDSGSPPDLSWPETADQLSEHLVFGGYFPWHATPDADGYWARWNDEGRHPDDNDINSMYWPEKGLYSSADPEVLKMQAREMQRAGIDIVIIFWNDVYPGEQQRVETAMRVFAEEGLRGIIAIDFNWTLPNDQKHQDMVSRLEFVMDKYAEPGSAFYDFYYRDPMSGQPVFMIYGPLRFGSLAFWNRQISAYKKTTQRGLFIAGKVSEMSLLAETLFDGIFWTGHAAHTHDREGHEFHLSSLQRGMFYIGGVIVGFDERHRPQEEVVVLPRDGGKTFEAKWSAVIRAQGPDETQVDHVYVPFNDWGEGIGIEPVSESAPERQKGYNDLYGRVPASYLTNAPLAPDAYIVRNQELAEKFKQSRR